MREWLCRVLGHRKPRETKFPGILACPRCHYVTEVRDAARPA